MISPEHEELAEVADILGMVERDFLHAALDPEESSRVEIEEDETLIIVDIPMIEKGRENRDDSQIYGTIPMGIVVAGGTVVTVCLQDTIILRSIAETKSRTSRRICAPGLSSRCCCVTPPCSCATCG